MKIDIKGLDSRETEDLVVGLGMEAYRGRQIRQWIFKRVACSFEDMTDLPKSMRALLKERASMGPIEKIKHQVSEDGTEKYLFRLSDGVSIESVLIPEKDHYTLCVSSQAGCAMGCRFCLTAKQGLKRNLKPSEIVDQVIQVKQSMDEPDRMTNIVLMGMGEPLANYDAVVKAIRILVSDEGANFSTVR